MILQTNGRKRQRVNLPPRSTMSQNSSNATRSFAKKSFHGINTQLVHTLSKVINDRQLMKVSEIEQELACVGTSVNGLEKQVEEIINDPSFGESEKVR